MVCSQFQTLNAEAKTEFWFKRGFIRNEAEFPQGFTESRSQEAEPAAGWLEWKPLYISKLFVKIRLADNTKSMKTKAD